VAKTDEELMAAYVAGDQSAFTQLFDRYAPMLTRMMRYQLPSAGDATDLVQQTFLHVHRARNDFRQGARLRPWLMTIAFNLKREYFRRRGRKPESVLEVEPASEEDSQERCVERKQASAKIRSALQRIPEKQREVIMLHWFQELSFPEIAKVVGAGLSAVKLRAHRGYKALREELAKVTTEPPSS